MNKLSTILREEGLLKKASQREYEDVIGHLLDLAESGRRLKYDGKTLWGGQGNTSGLHDYAEVERREKWERSGRRFEKKLRLLPPGAEVEIFFYRSTGSRGRWVPAGSFTIPDPNEAPKVDPNKVSMVNQDRDSNSFNIKFRGKTYRAGDTITLQDDFLWPGVGDGRPGDLILPKGSKVEITKTSLGLDRGYSSLGPSIGLTPLGKAFRFTDWTPPGEADEDDFTFTWDSTKFAVPGGQPLKKIMTALGFGDPPTRYWRSSDIPTGVFTLKKKYDWIPGSDPAFYSPRGSKVRINQGKRRGEMVFQPSKVLFKYEGDAPTAEEVRVGTIYTFKRDGFPLFSGLFDGSRTPPEQEAFIPEPYWARRRMSAGSSPAVGATSFNASRKTPLR